MSIDDRYPELCENPRAVIDRLIAQLTASGKVTMEELIAVGGIGKAAHVGSASAKQIAAGMARDLIRRCLDEAKPAGKPWINPTPWKRGRKAQRIRA